MRPTFEQEWRERFIEFAELRDDEAGVAGWSATGLEARVRRFLSLWKPLPAGSLWLDAGCGAGTYMRILADAGQRAIGADYSVAALSKRSAAARASGPVFAADVRALPFRPGTFDGVLCFGVLQALAESTRATGELAAQLRPGGELWVDALNAGCVIAWLQRLDRRLRGRPAHLRHESVRALRRLVRQQGLVDIEVHWMPIAPPRHRWLQAMFDSRFCVLLFQALPFLGSFASHAFIVRARRPASAA